MRIPVIHNVDVFVFGATTSAVSAALAAKEVGRTVLAVSDRSYFGEETAGSLWLWPEATSDHPLFGKVFGGTTSTTPPTPLHVKRTLEQELLERDVPFLLYCRPVFALRGAGGALAGFVLASRTSLYAVLCRTAIDASATGLLRHVAGSSDILSTVDSKETPALERRLVVLGDAPPTGAGFTWSEAKTPLPLLADDSAALANAYILSVQRNGTHPSGSQRSGHGIGFANRVSREFRDWAAIYYPGLQHTADSWLDDFDASSEFARQLEEGRRAGRLAAQAATGAAPVSGPFIATLGAERAAEYSDGRFGFAPGLLRSAHARQVIDIEIAPIPILHACDVLVAGGGTAGAPAGISAARAGAATVVLERQHGLGGVGTLGLITRYWFGNRVGFTREADVGVDNFSTQPKAVQKGGWNPQEKMGWYARALRDAGGIAWFHSFAFGVELNAGRVTGVLVATPHGVGLVRAGAVVDATGNADLAAAAGAPCREIGPDHVAVQGTGLSPLRPGVHYRNTDHTFIDENDPVGITHAFVNARAKFPKEFDVAPVIGSRERRQIHGEIELSPIDLLAGRTFPDTVVTAESNFDTHGFTVHPLFFIVPPDKSPLRAHVPFRCLLPRGVERLLVTGLGTSAHRDVLPVIRMQADVQNQGYAAGLAATWSARTGTDLRALDIRALQRELVAIGNLDPEVLSHGDSFPLPPEVVRAAVSRRPLDLNSVAVMLAHPEESVPLLIDQLRSADPADREDAALILGFVGRPEAVEELIRIVDGRDWDEGWNFRGMGQFGACMSRLDALVMALGRTRDPRGVDAVVRKIEALDGKSAFSHCRAVAVAAALLGGERLALALYGALQQPGMRGHAQVDSKDVVAAANPDPVETEARNAALKELTLARGLYLCGDHEGLGKSILETYANDLRGHFARHAQAILACRDHEELRLQVI